MTHRPNRRLVLVTGPSGAGRTTAIRALEDMGFEVIDNLPLSLIDRLLADDDEPRPLALGVDARNRDFSTDRFLSLVRQVTADPKLEADLLYLDARRDVLIQRYSETRRRHPMAPDETPEEGIAREVDLLAPIRATASILIDTSERTVHQTRADLHRLFDADAGPGLALTIQSFSYKRGLPMGADLVFDTRFLRNPHWETHLRPQDGRSSEVAAYVRSDERFASFFDRLLDLLVTALPYYRSEGKTHLSVAVGCTGGQHRSVVVTEQLAEALAEEGWRVSIRHRELERRGLTGAPEQEKTP